MVVARVHGKGQTELSGVAQQVVPVLRAFAAARAGSNMAARMARIAMTTSNSINVKAPSKAPFFFAATGKVIFHWTT